VRGRVTGVADHQGIITHAGRDPANRGLEVLFMTAKVRESDQPGAPPNNLLRRVKGEERRKGGWLVI